MENLKSQMLELVKANLPEATAGEMKKYIESAEETKKQLSMCEKKVVKLEKYIIDSEKDADTEREAKKLLELVIKEGAAKIEEVEAREIILKESERMLENTILKTELKCAHSSNDQVVRLVEKVFGHPSVTVTNMKSTSLPQPPDQYGNSQYLPDALENQTTITTPEKQ